MNAADYSMDDLTWFLRIARIGSLSSAAVQLGVPKSTLSRRLSRMESAMGVALVHRNSRSFRLTDIGTRLVEQAQPLVERLEKTTVDLLADEAKDRGVVRFSASGSFGRLVIVPLVSGYLLEHPEVRIEIELTDRKVNIIKEGFDFAIRIGDLPDSGLRVRRLCDVSRVLCAAPAYAKKHGLPATPADLAQHSCLIQSKSSASVTLEKGSQSATVFLPARLVAGPSDNLLVPVQMGVGISALPEIQVAGHLRRGELVRVLPDWSMPAFAAQILYPAQARLAPATRRLIEHLVARIPETVAGLAK